jgi:hypothetical protein
MAAKKTLLILAAAAASAAVAFSPAYAHSSALQETSAGRYGVVSGAGKCAFSANPYSVRRSVLVACGYRLVDRSYITKLPGGGESYVYYVDGHEVTFNIPPKGFKLLAATDRQLREYNLPSRDLLGGVRLWDRIMRRVQFTAPPRVLIEGPQKFTPNCPASPTCLLGNWAGYADVGHSDYNEVGADYVEPHISSSVCSNTAEATWVGIGGFTNGDTNILGQDGTSYGTGHPHGAWWEVLPGNAMYAPWDAAAGDTITATTTWNVADKKWEFSVIDGSHSLIPAEQSGSYSGTSAEFIVEMPGFALANFGTIPFSNAYVYYGSSGRHGVGQVPHDEVIMNDTQRNMAVPSSISGSDSQNFSIGQQHCN